MQCKHCGAPVKWPQTCCDLECRIHAYTDKTADGCWLWTGAINEKGYGVTKVDGRMQRAHRVSYEQFVGPIPNGLQIDHLCRNRRCVNPKHLEPVTGSQNVARGETPNNSIIFKAHRAKTHCPAGHPYSGANLIISKRGTRVCRECRRLRSKEYNRRKSGSEKH